MKVTLELVRKLDADARKMLRRRCQTDLYFLAKEVLGIPLYAPVHGQMCNLFVKKDPDKPFAEQSPIKQRLLLAPRNTMKTTMDEVDIVQWFLCFPTIRILLLTGTQDLGDRMTARIKKILRHECVRALFPELEIPDDDWGISSEVLIPGRQAIMKKMGTSEWKEPSLSSSTIMSAKASGHYEIIKCDDVVNERNAKTIDQRQKVIDSFDEAKYLLEPEYYVDAIGTRWDIQDLYGELIRRNADAEAEGEEPETKVLALSAWKIKDGVTLESNPAGVPLIRADDVELLYPTRIKFKELNKQYRNNPYSFSCQQLNAPDPTIEQATKSFDLALLQRHTIPYDGIPSEGKTYVCWDLAGYSQSASSDWTVGVVARAQDNKVYVLDIVHNKYTAVQQAQAIVDAAKKWRPETTIIEDAQGARALEPTIIRIAQEQLAKVPILWSQPPKFKNAKLTRIGHLAALIDTDQLWFANYAKNTEFLFEELCAYPASRHDDHADALAILILNLGLAPSVSISNETRQEIRNREFMASLFADTPTQSDTALLGSSLFR